MSPRGPSTVTVPAPAFAHPGPHDTPATTLRHVTKNLRGNYPVGGSNVAQGLADFLDNVADALGDLDPQLDPGPDLIVEQGDCRFAARCAGCLAYLEEIRPDQSFDLLAQAWDRHLHGGGCR